MASYHYAKRITDPETAEIDALIIAAAEELATEGASDISPRALAARLGIPSTYVDRRWQALRTPLTALAGGDQL